MARAQSTSGPHQPRDSASVAVPWLVPFLAFVAGVLATACAAPGADAAAPLRPAPILHLVYFHLEDPGRAPELLADCQELLTGIPGVVAYAAGTHLETGRDSVDSDYDLALLVGFPDEAAYQVYLGHEAHLELLARWKGRLSSYTIHDILDQPLP